MGDPRLFQVREVDIAIGILRHLATHVGGRAHQGGGNHAISRTATRGMARSNKMVGEPCQHVSLSVLIDQCHHAFFNIHGGELFVGDLNFGIDEGCTNGVGRVGFHGVVPVVGGERCMIPEHPPGCAAFGHPFPALCR